MYCRFNNYFTFITKEKLHFSLICCFYCCLVKGSSPESCLAICHARATTSDKNYGENCYLDNFVFLPPSLSYQCRETMSKNCVKLCYGFTTLYRWRGEILNTFFKIPIILCRQCTGLQTCQCNLGGHAPRDVERMQERW